MNKKISKIAIAVLVVLMMLTAGSVIIQARDIQQIETEVEQTSSGGFCEAFQNQINDYIDKARGYAEDFINTGNPIYFLLAERYYRTAEFLQDLYDILCGGSSALSSQQIDYAQSEILIFRQGSPNLPQDVDITLSSLETQLNQIEISLETSTISAEATSISTRSTCPLCVTR